MTPNKKPEHHPDNTAAFAPSPSSLDVLIPSLPNDVAMNVLARVPRRYHPILSAVSKPIRTAISSVEFFSLRSLLDCTEPILYLRLRRPYGWLALHERSPDPKPSKNRSNFILAPLPPVPLSKLENSSYAVMGPKIYVLGGAIGAVFNIPLTDVWVLDCRFHTWERGPSMQSPRFRPRAAVLDGKIFVFGGHRRKEDYWAEVLDPVAGCWEAIPRPPETHCRLQIDDCVVMGGKIRVWVTVREEIRFNPRTETWEVIEPSESEETDIPVKRCVVEETLYVYNERSETIKWFDDRNGKWKRLEGAVEGVSKSTFAWVSGIINAGGRLVVLTFSETREKKFELCFAEVEVKKYEDCGEVVQLGKILLQSQYLVPVCPCLSVSL